MQDKPVQPLTVNQRRVIGVLVEKSKTTPDVYPMTLNSIRNACNQKSNRSPVMDLSEERVEDTLYELRELGAAIEVHSNGRVAKFKHELYEWLAVDKAELAVMTELLLRGEQTLGDLRARSARMESSLKGIGDLVPVVNQLISKGLIIELTPKGRGQMITHNLYLDEEVDRFRQSYSDLSRNEIRPRDAVNSDAVENSGQQQTAVSEPGHSQPMQASPIPAADTGASDEQGLAELRSQVELLTRQVAELTEKVNAIQAND